MKPVERPISGLEDRFAPAAGQQIVVSLYDAGQKLALDGRTGIQILRDAGHINPASARGLYPHSGHLNASELEKHLREDGAGRRPQ